MYFKSYFFVVDWFRADSDFQKNRCAEERENCKPVSQHLKSVKTFSGSLASASLLAFAFNNALFFQSSPISFCVRFSRPLVCWRSMVIFRATSEPSGAKSCFVGFQRCVAGFSNIPD